MTATMKNIVCAISGGVDSCVAALLLKRQGYNVQGVFMRNWDLTDERGYCQADADRADAEFICRKLDIPFSEVNFVKEYWNNIFSPLIEDYIKGLTPNPDILCNKIIKFDLFLKHALKHLGADAVATGHYARIVSHNSKEKGFHLLKGIDINKDQTFFLSQIPRTALEKCIFPIGEMTKGEVKNIAFSSGFRRIAEKKESMGICFIGKRRSFHDFIDDYVESKVGHFVNVEDGTIMGQHKGVHCWTVGQKCTIGGLPIKFYVAERNCENQEILIAPGRMHPSLFHQTIVTQEPYWINCPPVDLENGEHFLCDFRFQHREPVVKCLLYKDKAGHLQIFLQKPLRALTPGQYAVFYTGDECLGSARILYRGPSMYHIESIQNKAFS